MKTQSGYQIERRMEADWERVGDGYTTEKAAEAAIGVLAESDGEYDYRVVDAAGE